MAPCISLKLAAVGSRKERLSFRQDVSTVWTCRYTSSLNEKFAYDDDTDVYVWFTHTEVNGNSFRQLELGVRITVDVRFILVVDTIQPSWVRKLVLSEFWGRASVKYAYNEMHLSPFHSDWYGDFLILVLENWLLRSLGECQIVLRQHVQFLIIYLVEFSTSFFLHANTCKILYRLLGRPAGPELLVFILYSRCPYLLIISWVVGASIGHYPGTSGL